MPSYTNSTNDIIFAGDPYIKLAPGDTTTDKYIKDLPTGVTLKSHEPVISPWTLLEADEDGLIDVSGYDTIEIYNGSDEVATISANTDDDNALTVMVSSKEIFDNTKRYFGCLAVLTKGSTGSVYVWGLK